MPEATQVLRVADAVSYQDGGIVSRQLLKKTTGNITAFAFDAGQELTEHTSPFEAVVHVIDGEATVAIAGQPHAVPQGEMIILPANVPRPEAPGRERRVLRPFG